MSSIPRRSPRFARRFVSDYLLASMAETAARKRMVAARTAYQTKVRELADGDWDDSTRTDIDRLAVEFKNASKVWAKHHNATKRANDRAIVWLRLPLADFARLFEFSDTEAGLLLQLAQSVMGSEAVRAVREAM
jgi:hypothetical protein